MNDSAEPRKLENLSLPIRRFTWILVAAWAVVVSGLTIHEIIGIRQVTREIALGEIRAYSNKDSALHRWAASHHGVYVQADERTPANPYLEDIPERDLLTPSGRKLTLMSPAYMMRQVGEDFADTYGCRSKMTSLNPLRPENGPDAWERRALDECAESGVREKLEFTRIDGVPHLRLLQALPLTQGCLRCHVHQGDVRGGISVSLPMVELLGRENRQIFSHGVRAGLLWLIGVIGLFFGDRFLQRRVAERDAAQEALQISRDLLALQGRELEEVNVELSEEIAERKRVEAEILASEEKFRTVADFTYDWEYWRAPEGRFLYVSPAVERITGYRPEEFLEDPGLLLSITHPDHKGQLAEHFRQVGEEENGVSMLELRIITRSGQERWIGHTCQPVYGQAGEFLGRRASNRDITCGKWHEKTLDKFAAELAQSNKDLQDFAAMASHDLREPLILILAFSEKLGARYGEGISTQGLEYIRRIKTAAEQMRELITGILAYSQVSAKTRPFKEVDLQTIVLRVVADLEVRIAEAGGRVEVDCLCRVKADSLQLRQLFQNLIANSLKYRKADVPPLVFVSGRVIADPEGDGTQELCRITVEDNGIGFQPEYAEKIFGFFQRLHGRDQYEGTGIGLAVCKRIVERHGGTITAESAPGAGARFIVTLPVHGPAVDEHRQAACLE